MQLDELVTPAHTALVTMEVQRGVVGDLATIPALREAADAVGLVPNVAAVAEAARAVSVRVVHCCATFRRDLAGSVANNRLLAMSVKANAELMVEGGDGAELVPELAGHDEDIVLSRIHGLTPFTSTSLDQILRNLGVRTLVAVGCSLNVGVLGLALSASDLGYQLVVPRDAVVGVPVDYGETILDNTVAMVATLTSTQELTAAWAGAQ